MELQLYLTLGILLGMVCALVFEWARTATVLFFTLTAFLLFGIITPEQALSGFSNQATIAIALLFVVAAGIQKTGVVDVMTNTFLSNRKVGNIISSLLRVMVPASILSAFMTNTTVVTVFTPIIKRWATWSDQAASKYLIPLSYATIFGGMCTLIGTTANIVVHGLMLEHGMNGISMFELAKVGIPCVVVGWAYLALVGHRLLPDRRDLIQKIEGDKKEYVIEMKVNQDCEFVGKSIQDAGLRNLKNVFLLSIDRNSKLLGAVSPDEVIQANDRLIFVGMTSAILELQEVKGFVPAAHKMFEDDFLKMSSDFVEAVVSHSSPLLDKTVKEANFRSRYHSGVIAVHRNGERVAGKIGDIKIRPGDTLLLLATPTFLKAWSDSKDFYLVSKIKTQEPVKYKKAAIAVSILTAMVGLFAFKEQLPLIGGQKVTLVYAAFAAAALMRLTGCVTTPQARSAVQLDVLLAIACAIGISYSMEASGASAAIAKGVIRASESVGTLGSLSLVYLGTVVLAFLVTNIAAATIFFPIALATATTLGVNPHPFIIAVVLAASANFSSPVSYQTNLIVQGVGGYKFMDYVRVGLPLNLLFFITTIALIPIYWPF